MAGCVAGHHGCKVSLGDTGYTASTRGGITQGVGKFLQGGGAGDSTVWVGNMVSFGDNGEECGWDTHWVTLLNHREVSEAAKRQDMGDAWSGRRTRSSRNAVGEDLHRETTGNRGSVGGSTSSI